MHGSRKASPPSEVSIKRAANGGYIVRHSYDNSMSGPSYTPPQEHAFANHKAMMSHVHSALGGKMEEPSQVKDAPTKAAGAAAARKHGAGVD